MFTIHPAKVFKLPYPGAVENSSLKISETILNYSNMSVADRLESKSDELDQSGTSEISRLTYSTASKSRAETAAKNERLDQAQKALSLRNKLVAMHKRNKICV